MVSQLVRACFRIRTVTDLNRTINPTGPDFRAKFKSHHSDVRATHHRPWASGKSQRRLVWNLAFISGSAGASFFQGIILGAYLRGISISAGRFSGDPFFWLQPFSWLTGLGLMSTYALLGAAWLVIKTNGDLQHRMHQLLWSLTVVLLLFMVAVSV